ncbi:MAG: BON domain-containing protein, partial [Planctomycetes bacterium]|nr:BON domain-containing protein [Planctomycetota bacterium]
MNRQLLIATTLASTLACGSAMAAGDRASDTWTEASITTAYTLNEHLNPFDIDVEVRDGTAMLQGSVESDVERELAEQIALGTEGVRNVENRLTIGGGRPVAGHGAAGGGFAQVVNDATLTARVKSQLLWNQETSGLEVTVTTENRVVTLSGAVDSSAERDVVGQIAVNTDGVLDVQNELTVDADTSIEESAKDTARDAGRAVSDSWVTAKVKSALLFNRGVDGATIGVETSDGVVTLSGVVDGAVERQRAVAIAAGIVGVKSVRTAFETE